MCLTASDYKQVTTTVHRHLTVDIPCVPNNQTVTHSKLNKKRKFGAK